MWVLILVSSVGAIIGIAVVVFYALRLTKTWSLDLDPGSGDASVTSTDASGNVTSQTIFKNESGVSSGITSTALARFELKSYENVNGYTQLDDSYLGVYKQADTDAVTDFTSNVGTRLHVWVNEGNSERIIGLYKDGSTYNIRIAYYEDNATYGERLVNRVVTEDLTASANIVSYTGDWVKTMRPNNINAATIHFVGV